jgi:2-hydroxy-3-keto-5-methylthiopentenyl-1-phosphate phosphatase
MGSLIVPTPRTNCHVFIDFDGTIVPCDATDFLFERFALPEWRDVENDWQSGKIGSRECLAKQAALLRATPAQLNAAVDEIQVDAGFAGFVAQCKAAGIGATIVSDGFDRVIEAVMRRNGIDIPFFANHLEPTDGDRWRVTFPHSREDCVALAGHCKCMRAAAVPRALKVVVGDGRSDFCIAGQADLVFAKSKLLELCRSNGTFHVPFNDFFEVGTRLDDWLSSGAAAVAGAAPGVTRPASVVPAKSINAT